MSHLSEVATKVVDNVERVIVGKNAEVKLSLVAMLSKGHILVEDVPGVGKTVLAKSLARSLGCSFKRIQFTPDLLPSDVTGVSIYNQSSGEFEYRPGPVTAQVVLADEINRATPKTQSSLLEAMEERQTTVDGVTYPLPEPFLVLATENPIEYEGTFPLPEAQLDRFLLRLSLGYPDKSDEVAILQDQHRAHPLDSLEAVVSAAEFVQAQEEVKAVHVDQVLVEYIVSLSIATREHEDVYLGASPRGSLGLYRASQAYAAMADRDYVTPDDVKAVAVSVLSHRLILNASARMKQSDARSVVADVLSRVPVPGAWAVSGSRSR